MIIRDKWYVIYDGKIVIDWGNGLGFRIDCGEHSAVEFDTEAEMQSYIQENELISKEEEECC